MRKHTVFLLAMTTLSLWLAPPAFGVSKETIRMMAQLDDLQQAVQNMQRNMDTQTAVLKTLIEQTSDNVTAMKATITELQKTNGENLAKDQNRFDALTSQVQALSESLEEAKARLAKLDDKVAQTQSIIQTLNTPQSQPASGTAAGAQPAPGASTSTPGQTPAAGQDSPRPRVPDANSLYEQGLTYYNSGQYDLAIQAFQQYLQYYSDTDLASNAQFYIGECYYGQGDYKKAIEQYNQCVERYPTGNKLAAAQLKKGYALLELGQTQAGARELRSLVERYPNSREAELARQRLKKLTAASASRRR
ncbi:MAG TPA: tol-pal system protein YbgF [Terriglobia bacterium]|nr:tol-pal system protein YbgF [Terriglobia bacterium]